MLSWIGDLSASIAKQAGVGPGTLYRHFPSRTGLVLAVYSRDVQQLLDVVLDGLQAGAPAAGRSAKSFASWLRAGQSRGN